jgi:hypothetical protein
LYALNGEITNTQIWTISLGATDITTLYNNGVPLLTGTQPQAANLKAWYPMNVDNANWLGSDWQIAEATSAYPQSFDFDGSSEIINLGNDASLYPQTGDMSYSFWVNPDVLSGYQTIYGRVGMSTTSKCVNIELFGSEVRVFMGVGVNGQWGVNTGGGTGGAALTTSSSGLTVGQWTHVAVTLDRDGNGVIYINGVANVTAAMNPNDYSAVDIVESFDILIGNGNGYLNGKTSNVQVWNSNLSSTQVETLYNNGSPLTTAIASSNLKAWYKLDNTETYLKPPPSQTQNLYEAWLIQNQKYPASVDNCLLFANQNYIRYDNFDLINEAELTLSFWYLHNQSINSSDRLIGSWDGTAYNFYVNVNRSGIGGVSGILRTNDGSGGFLNNSFSFGDVNTPAVGWRLLTVTYNGSVLKAYVNDEEVDSVSATGTIYDLNPYIGGARNYNQSIRDGNGSANGMRLSNVIYWNKALTAGELTTLYNNGTPLLTKDSIPQDSSMLLWNTLENKTETVGGGLYDKSGNSVSIQNIDNTSTIIVDNAPVSAESGLSSGMTESNLVNNNVSALNGTSSGMTTANLVNSDLTRSIPYSSYSMYFDGTGDEVDFSSSTFGTGLSNFSVSAWAKFDGSSVYECIASVDGVGGRVWQLFQWSSNRGLAFQLFNNSGTGAVTPVNSFINASNTWYHVVGTYDGSNIRLYVNGNLEATVAQTGTVRASTAENLKIGSNGYNEDLEGNISNVSLYNKALTQAEIIRLYNGGVPSKLSTLNLQPNHYWSLGSDSYFNGADWIVPDLVSTLNGTSNGLASSALVGDGPGGSANGTATNMDIPANLKGDAPNSSSNAFSVNMDTADRVASVPS